MRSAICHPMTTRVVARPGHVSSWSKSHPELFDRACLERPHCVKWCFRKLACRERSRRLAFKPTKDDALKRSFLLLSLAALVLAILKHVSTRSNCTRTLGLVLQEIFDFLQGLLAEWTTSTFHDQFLHLGGSFSVYLPANTFSFLAVQDKALLARERRGALRMLEGAVHLRGRQLGQADQDFFT